MEGKTLSVREMMKLGSAGTETRRSIPRPVQRKDIQLFKPQAEDMERMYAILMNINPVARNTSETGLGKSLITMALANRLEVPLFVICPGQVAESWKTKLDQYNMYFNTTVIFRTKDVIYGGAPKGNPRSQLGKNIIISYDQLKAMAKDTSQRDTYVVKVGNAYHITPMFLELMQQDNGMLLVVDESQATKNDSVQSAVTAGLVRAIVNAWYNADDDLNLIYRAPSGKDYNVGNMNRAIMLSATPIDKVEQIPRVMYYLGLVDSPILLKGEQLVAGRDPKELMTLIRRLGEVEQRDNDGYADAVATAVTVMAPNYIPRDRKNPNLFAPFNEWNLTYPPIKPGGRDAPKAAQNMARELWDNFASKYYSSETIPFIERNCYKGYFDIGKDRITDGVRPSDDYLTNFQLYMKAVQLLHDVHIAKGDDIGIASLINTAGGINVDPDEEVYTKGSKKGAGQMAAIQLAIEIMDDACFTGACTFLLKKLRTVPDSKVIIGVSRLRIARKCVRFFEKNLAVNGIYTEVGKYWTGTGRGQIKPETRAETLRIFQEDNDRMRVLVATTKSGLGFDLNDKSTKAKNGRQRFIVAFPSYEVMPLHQFLGRSARVGSTTIPKSYIFYPAAAGTVCEAILSSMRQKTEILDTSVFGTKYGRVFPSHYPRYVDGGWGDSGPGYYIDDYLIQQIIDGEEEDIPGLDYIADLKDDIELLRVINNPKHGVDGVPLRDEPPARRPPIPEELKEKLGLNDGDATYQDGIVYVNANIIPPTYNTVVRGELVDIGSQIKYVNTPDSVENYNSATRLLGGIKRFAERPMGSQGRQTFL